MRKSVMTAGLFAASLLFASEAHAGGWRVGPVGAVVRAPVAVARVVTHRPNVYVGPVYSAPVYAYRPALSPVYASPIVYGRPVVPAYRPAFVAPAGVSIGVTLGRPYYGW